MDTDELPKTRSEWAILDWQQAQNSVAQLLNRFGFMIFKEKRLNNNKRSDIVVYRINKNEIIFGIIEVKTYRKVTPSMVKKTIQQACNYLELTYFDVKNNHRWTNKVKKFFIASVFTKDYPASFQTQKLYDFQKFLPEDLIKENNCRIIITTPNRLIEDLNRSNLVEGFQKNIEDYF